MNILITGVSKGVGLELLKILLTEGHTCYGISRSQTKELKLLEKNIAQFRIIFSEKIIQ